MTNQAATQGACGTCDALTGVGAQATTDAGLGVSVERWDPKMAQHVIDDHLAANRRINPDRVDQYARAMKAGRWIVNGETFAFDRVGQLFDGQHRLYAIVKADTPVTVIVVRGIRDLRDAQDTTDAGQSRQAAQQLALRGEAHSTVLAAALRWNRELAALVGDEARPGNRSMGALEAKQELDLHPHMRASVQLASNQLSKGVSRYPGGIAATLHYWFKHELDEPDDADAFWQLFHDLDLKEPRVTVPVDHPVGQLQRTLAAIRAESGKRKTTLDYVWVSAVTIKAWNAWRDGTPIKNLRWRRGGSRPEPFPAPR